MHDRSKLTPKRTVPVYTRIFVAVDVFRLNRYAATAEEGASLDKLRDGVSTPMVEEDFADAHLAAF